MWVEFESSAGVLVTGGLGPEDEVLSSAEFYDVNTKEWHQVCFYFNYCVSPATNLFCSASPMPFYMPKIDKKNKEKH